jgi:hypothetical protein
MKEIFVSFLIPLKNTGTLGSIMDNYISIIPKDFFTTRMHHTSKLSLAHD